MKYISHYDSPIGKILLASDSEAITGLWFAGQKHYARGLKSGCTEKPLPVFRQAKNWLDIYFSGENPGFIPPIKAEGTPFQKSVWKILLGIPYGKTISYGEIAKTIAEQKGIAKMSAQAAGTAVGLNHISIIIPCHRAIRTDGSLSGYAGGTDRKIWLLERERGNN